MRVRACHREVVDPRLGVTPLQLFPQPFNVVMKEADEIENDERSREEIIVNARGRQAAPHRDNRDNRLFVRSVMCPDCRFDGTFRPTHL